LSSTSVKAFTVNTAVSMIGNSFVFIRTPYCYYIY
jgi:hypothetical protein